jgi:hypothetical protein
MIHRKLVLEGPFKIILSSGFQTFSEQQSLILHRKTSGISITKICKVELQ